MESSECGLLWLNTGNGSCCLGNMYTICIYKSHCLLPNLSKTADELNLSRASSQKKKKKGRLMTSPACPVLTCFSGRAEVNLSSGVAQRIIQVVHVYFMFVSEENAFI